MPSYTRIKERRLYLKLTQEQLVERLHLYGLVNFTPSHISKLERGLRVVKAEEVPIFATALECNVVDLHDEKPERKH